MKKLLIITIITTLLTLSDSIFSPSFADNGWVILNQTDPMTDKATNSAYKQFELDGTAKIEALANCTNENITFQFTFHTDPKYYGEGFQYSYDRLVTAISGMKPHDMVHFSYRLDSNKASPALDSSPYKNRAELRFYSPSVATANPEIPLPNAADLKATETLRVQLPIEGGRKEAFGIRMSDLKGWLATCPQMK